MKRRAAFAFLALLAPRLSAAELVVTNATDTVNGNTSSPPALVASPGADGISLREAIAACNNATGPHAITFAASLAGQTIVLTSGLQITRDGITITGTADSDGRPGITLRVPSPDAAFIVIEVLASDFSLNWIRLAEVRQKYGLEIYAGNRGAPQTISNIQVADCEFVGDGDINNKNIAISIGDLEAAVGAKISGVSIVGSSFRHFSGADCIHIPSNGIDCVIENVRIEGNRFEDSNGPVELTPSHGGTNNRFQGTEIVRNTFIRNVQCVSFYIANSPGYATTVGNMIADTVISDNIFIDNHHGLNLGTGTADTRDNQVLRTQILCNTFTGTTGPAIVLNHGGRSGQPATNNTMADTTISENIMTDGVIGVSLSGGAANTTGCLITGTRLVGNRITNQSGSAVVLQMQGGAAANKISDTTITQNFLADNADGISLSVGNAVTVGDAILNTEISNNVISGTKQGAAISLVVDGTGASNNRIDGVTIVSDTVADNPLKSPAVTGVISGTGTTISGVRVRNTVFWNNSGGDVASLPFFSDVSFCLTADKSRAGLNGNIAADPKFVDAASRDYHLRANSPAIDAGTSDGAPSADFEGRPRFDDPGTPNTGGGATKYVDIGACEFAPTLTQGRIINLSILTSLATPGDTFTVGTVLGGAGTGGRKPLLLRAAGPSLAPFGVINPLADPKLDLFSGQTVVASNDNWDGTAALNAAFAHVGAFAFTSATSSDAAVYNSALSAGSHTVQISGVGSATGVVIAELYDATPTNALSVTTPRLINVSVLKDTGSGLSAGFVIGGATSMKVLVRAIGPSLAAAPFHVPGAMADPRLELFDRAAQSIATNNDWGGTPELTRAFASVGAFALDAASKDAALIATLAPGNYTVQVTAASGSAGVAMVEVYEVP